LLYVVDSGKQTTEAAHVEIGIGKDIREPDALAAALQEILGPLLEQSFRTPVGFRLAVDGLAQM